VDKKNIRKGLLAIKGLGPKAAQRIVEMRPEGGYLSVEHFCRTVGSRISGTKAFIESGDTEVGILGSLITAGAFRSITDE
jgi:DNA polymerase III alpha subunit